MGSICYKLEAGKSTGTKRVYLLSFVIVTIPDIIFFYRKRYNELFR